MFYTHELYDNVVVEKHSHYKMINFNLDNLDSNYPHSGLATKENMERINTNDISKPPHNYVERALNLINYKIN